jgi:hypothetical protein
VTKNVNWLNYIQLVIDGTDCCMNTRVAGLLTLKHIWLSYCCLVCLRYTHFKFNTPLKTSLSKCSNLLCRNWSYFSLLMFTKIPVLFHLSFYLPAFWMTLSSTVAPPSPKVTLLFSVEIWKIRNFCTLTQKNQYCVLIRLGSTLGW